MASVILVGAGGCIGAVFRYLMGLIPYQGSFPVITLLINFCGGILIGALAACSELAFPLHPGLTLFLKTGVCGGFTTFSAFSLEVFDLLAQDKKLLGIGYAGISLILCVAGVWLGKTAVYFIVQKRLPA